MHMSRVNLHEARPLSECCSNETHSIENLKGIKHVYDLLYKTKKVYSLELHLTCDPSRAIIEE